MPVLINHLHDYRLTRTIRTTDDGRYTWHVRIADVVADLLDELANEPFAYDFRALEGRGKSLDKAYALHWWSQVQKSSALDYLRKNALTRGRDGKLEANPALLRQLGTRDPETLIKLFKEKLDEVQYSYPFFEALTASKVAGETKLALFLAAATGKDSRNRCNAIAELLNLNHPEAVPLLVKELESVPRTPKEAYWLTNTAQVARLVTQTDDERAWNALAQSAKRVDMGQRLEMLEAIGGTSGRRQQHAIDFLVRFLDDKQVRVRRDLNEQASTTKDGDDFFKQIESDLFRGPSAGFMFDRLVVGDFAALQLAYTLQLDVDRDPGWAEADWANLRARVQKAIAERNRSKVTKPTGRK